MRLCLHQCVHQGRRRLFQVLMVTYVDVVDAVDAVDAVMGAHKGRARGTKGTWDGVTHGLTRVTPLKLREHPMKSLTRRAPDHTRTYLAYTHLHTHRIHTSSAKHTHKAQRTHGPHTQYLKHASHKTNAPNLDPWGPAWLCTRKEER